MSTPLTPELLRRFLNLASAMSPENLHWDGERSRTAAARALRGLKAEWRALEALVGRRVTEDEVWMAHIRSTR